MSNFNFCPVVWMLTSKSLLNRLEDIQRRALGFVLCDYDSCYTNLLKAASVPGIRINLLRCLAIEVFKCVNGFNPDYLNKMIHKYRVHTRYATNPFCPDLKLIILITVSKLSVAMEPKYGIYTARIIEIGAVSLRIQTNDKIMGWSQLLLLHLYPISMIWRQVHGPTIAFTWLCDVLC